MVPTAGPCLKPWPDPPPTIHTFGHAGWRSMMKSPLDVFSYWQTCASTSGAVPSAGNRRAKKARGRAHRVVADDPLGRVRVDRRAVPVDADLEAVRVEVGNAVEPCREVDPGGQAIHAEARVARRHAEVQHLLPGRPDPAADGLGEEAGQPGPASEDVVVGREDLAGLQANHGRSRRLVGRRDPRLPIPGAVCARCRDRRGHGAPRADHPAARFVHGVAEANHADLRVETRHRRGVEPFVRDPGGGERAGRLGQVSAAMLSQEERAAFDDEGLARACRQPVPVGQRTGGPPRVDLEGAVAGADHARVIGGARAAVRRPIGVHERDLPALTRQAQRAPRAEHARAHDDRRRLAHHTLQYQPSPVQPRQQRV